MPLPLILGAVAAITGVTHGAVKIKEAMDTRELADRRDRHNTERFARQKEMTTRTLAALGKTKAEAESSFWAYSDAMEKIHSRPEFKPYQQDGVEIPNYDGEELKEVSIGADALLGSLGGVVLGTAGGIAAFGAVIALGAGFLVGDIIFTGLRLSKEADAEWEQVIREREWVNQVCDYLESLDAAARAYHQTFNSVLEIYWPHLEAMVHMVNDQHKTDWKKFTLQEKLCVENTTLLVGLLYSMCKVQLVEKAYVQGEMDMVNQVEIDLATKNAEQFLATRDFTLKV